MTLRARRPTQEDWKTQIPCQSACPVRTDAGLYVELIAGGRYEEAYNVARAPNPFASICGRICSAPCEDACRRRQIDAPVSIRALKRFVTERHGVESPSGETSRPSRSSSSLDTRSGAVRKVAVIGAGPGGLAAAHDLAVLGYSVTVFEAADAPGGMLRFGVPDYRLPRPIIRAEIDSFLDLGVHLRLNTPLSPAFGLSELRRAGFEAVFLSAGAGEGRELTVPGTGFEGVLKGVDFLRRVNRGEPMSLGPRVVVVGGGFVAFDSARSAMRLISGNRNGAQDLRNASSTPSVTLVSLESQEELPILQTFQGLDEFHEARREGVAFLPRRGPKRFLGDTRLEAIELRRVTRVFDADGRFDPVYDDDDVITIPCDTACVLAVGQRSDLSFLKPQDAVELTPLGTIKVDTETLATSAPGVFSGGDVAFGPRNLIDAVADGRRAARSIDAFLSQTDTPARTEIQRARIPTNLYRRVPGFELLDRVHPPRIEAERRTAGVEVEGPFEEPEARRQASRCLACHIQPTFDASKCVLCSRCVDICPELCLGIVPYEELELPASEREELADLVARDDRRFAAMLMDEERCIRCGLCAIRCPTDAMTMVRSNVSCEIGATGVQEGQHLAS